MFTKNHKFEAELFLNPPGFARAYMLDNLFDSCVISIQIEILFSCYFDISL